MTEINRQSLMERRRNQRYPYDARIWLEETFGAPLIKLNTINVSASGLLFLSSTDYPIGKRMKILIELPYFLDLVETDTSVRHVTPHDDDQFMVGVNLELIEGMSEAALRRFLSALMEEESSTEDTSSLTGDTKEQKEG